MTPSDPHQTGLTEEPVPSVSVRQVVGAVVVAATGAVDMVTAPHLQEAVTDVLADGPFMVIIDLSDVDFLASAALTVLLQARRDAGRGTAIRVVATGTARRAIDLTGLDGPPSVHATLTDALNAQ